jgi:RNA polymerase sigma-70 factor (ECF subfamily)
VGPESDRALVALLKRGDPAAFERAYTRSRARIYGFLVRMTGSRHVAEDLFQETWIKLAVHASRLRDDTDLAGWLYTVARNLARSYLRSPHPETSEPGLAHADDAPSPFDWASANQTEANLERALALLEPQFREVLLLVAVDGLAQDQVAHILGVSHDAVRQRLARGRAKLAELLDALAEPRTSLDDGTSPASPERGRNRKEKSHAAG